MAGTGSRVAAAVAVVTLISVAAMSAQAGPGASAPAIGSGAGGVTLKPIGEFEAPTHVTSAPGRSNRRLLFVVEQEGTVRVIRRGNTLPQPFLDITDRVQSGGERGLLSMAFDADYETNRRFYVYFTDADGAIRVSQFRRSRESKTFADPGSGRLVIKVPHADAPNHNGGQVAFGPDGNLWLATGDGGSACDPPENAQNPNSLLGKLLRVDPGNRGGYEIPAGNPFADGPGADEIYALGLRNPYRFSFDRPANAIAIGDVGQNAFEEINYETLGGARGANFGWDAREGSAPLDRPPFEPCASDGDTPAPPETEDPIHTYAHSGGGFTGCAVIGGLVVRDPDLPTLFGRYLYSDNCNGSLRSLVPALGGASGDADLGLDVSRPSSFGSDRSNHVYVTSLLGPLYRLRPGPAAPARPLRSSRPRVGDGQGGFKTRSIGGFDSPVHVTGPDGANGLVFVVEQAGVIRLIKGGERVGGKFLDISNKVLSGGERGLLSVAFATSYAANRRFYVFFTDEQGDLKVQEYRTSKGDPRDAKEGSARTVLEIRHRSASNHNGGQLQFGPDRKLYISTGDGGDTPQNAQDKGSLLGKILRIDPRRRGNQPYTIPADNPFRGRPGKDEIFSLGLRNPFRFSFDRARRKIAIGDVGQESREEVDYETLGDARGANFGWDSFEGTIPYDSPTGPPPEDAVAPIHDYSHGSGNCAITGGYVSRDKRVRSLFGRYVYADFCRGQIRSLIPKLSGGRDDRPVGLPSQPGISSFGEDTSGRIWFTNLNDGRVFAIKPG